MKEEKLKRSISEGRNIASIDIGSYTARLLIAQVRRSSELFKPLARKRGYIRLADGFDRNEGCVISPEAIGRTLDLLEDFTLTLKHYDVDACQAVATGVVRDAVNQDHFLRLIHDKTGIKAMVISGEEEAFLTRKGISHSLNIDEEKTVIFDLGGGTTEFIADLGDDTEISSVPLGAMVLTQRFFTQDPPAEEEIDGLVRYVNNVLDNAFSHKTCDEESLLLIGSGGTVTTIAAMVNGIAVKEISSGRLNGLLLERDHIEDLFGGMKSLPMADRLKLPGLDRGRAGVILAGTLAVVCILRFFRASRIKVSYSDILEGTLIKYLLGDNNE